MKIIHIADVHFRGLTRHDEYRRAFQDFFDQARKIKPDAIFVGGDIVHSKTQGISPELIDILTWWFTELADIAPTHIILGNHDGLILNKDRQDAISPILSAINNENLFLYKKSGVYSFAPGFNWCVFSCFDEEGWALVKPEPGSINIATFHGSVHGSQTDINWDLDGEVNISFFVGYDFALLGDIHRHQYLDDDKKIAFCGSSIQQNYGESQGKGFMLWDIESPDVYTSTFHEIYHDQPFITVDWCGNTEDTMNSISSLKKGARYRVRSDTQINQAEIKLIHSELKNKMKATEVVFKHDADIGSSVIKAGSDIFEKDDLQLPATHKKLVREYLKNTEISQSESDEIDNIIDSCISEIVHKPDPFKRHSWNIKSILFDNTFSYGKNNKIDFSKFGGITGIFGKNRSGKSSIVGSIMYGLFNTTDRGSIKNLHVINSRKGQCSARVTINVNGKNYRIERQTVKHQTRAGKLHATTYLGVYIVDKNGEIIKDLTEEQRRESEKIVKALIGTPEDFLMTSLASQGEMNTFIKEKATQRKNILSNFLDLGVFDSMFDKIKDEASEIKTLIKKSPDIDWNDKILKLEESKNDAIDNRHKTNDDIENLKKELHTHVILLATHKDKDLVSKQDVDELCENILKIRNEAIAKKDDLEIHKKNLDLSLLKIEKIENIKNQFPIANLKEKLQHQKKIEADIKDLSHQLDKEQTILKNQNKSIKKLESVPCGDSFLSCKFIKDSHKDRKKISEQKETVKTLSKTKKTLLKSFKIIKEGMLEEKIEKYNNLLQSENKEKISASEIKSAIINCENQIENFKRVLLEKDLKLQKMKLNISDDIVCSEVRTLKLKISNIEDEVKALDNKSSNYAEKIGRVASELRIARQEFNNFNDLKRKWRIYELLMQSFSKKGIPLQIMMSQLPIINDEISRILQDLSGFTVRLVADSGSNAMDVYIDYGDSSRIIELASGMEKMMASLAIRVALINVSSLPKTNILIIDEGFGSLDDTNIEMCSILLQSLKKWFKHIMIISHVDAVKDVVDNVIDIEKCGKDSRVVHG